MIVILLENVSTSLKGELTRWMIEPRAGVFVGDLSALVREKLWKKVINERDKCNGGMIFYTINNEQGYDIEMFGETKRTIIDFEGLKLVNYPQS